MKLTKPSDVRALLADMDFHPSRTLGQNFLIDFNILTILLDAAELNHRDGVLEIGPGLGVLTEGLLNRAGRVVGVEKDQRLFNWLEQRFEQFPALVLHHADALDLDMDALLVRGLNKVVANLPYGIASRFLMNVLGCAHPPERIVVTVQAEVARRFAAAPSSRDYGLVSVPAQLAYAVTVHKRISPTCFWPAPEVTSAILLMVRRPQPLVAAPDRQALLDLLKFCFSRRRKQLGTILRQWPAVGERAVDVLTGLGLAPTDRPENIAPADWARLANALP
ncbi:MAG: 16S rRNA (adenine(1518)-N(6)/adenine(1519)-N(6))-dimethyltransferase RsmA [Kiritimatiellaeota bacterium]|nr:16S rRNA (adenine(1518)-N(6)/adenine(1519)-N(6))-dimethyltransferase RsmA [Kiritimatiellota bacterium]